MKKKRHLKGPGVKVEPVKENICKDPLEINNQNKIT